MYISAGAGAVGGVGFNGVVGTNGDNANGQTPGTNYILSQGGAGAQQSTISVSTSYCFPDECINCYPSAYWGYSGWQGSTETFAAGGGPGSNVCYSFPHTERPGPAGNGANGQSGVLGGVANTYIF